MKTYQLLNRFKENILDILLPRLCLGCGREGAYICKNCEVFLSEVEPLLKSDFNRSVEVRLQQVQQMPEIVSVWEYEGIIEKAIHKIKYSGCYDIIDELMEKAIKKIELNLPEDIIITHVPMWPKKERLRGFNQSEMIARQLGLLLSRSEQCMLEKVSDNRSQVGLGPKERAENVRGVFRMRRERKTRLPVGSLASTDERNVLLVDDVYTTGATIGECMKVLKKAGVKNVWGFTLARKLSL